jgi:sortase A
VHQLLDEKDRPMGLPYTRRRKTHFSFFQLITMGVGVGLVILAVQRFDESRAPALPTLISDITPTVPSGLSRMDVLPTPTIDYSKPRRNIVFPAAALTSPIIEAIRIENTWETRYLGDSVGHLEGTAWLAGLGPNVGNNIVLAGHVENERGEPGPFAHLFEVSLDDLIILQEGATSIYYRVTKIERASPQDVFYTFQEGSPRLTLITCTDYNYQENTYAGRLIVIAEPIQLPQVSTGIIATPTPQSQ